MENSSYDRNTGRLLEEARRQRGLSLEAAARQTGIPAHVLEGLEKEDAARLPAAVYARLFLKNYADSLGLDGREVSGRWEPGRKDGPSPKGRSRRGCGRRWRTYWPAGRARKRCPESNARGSDKTRFRL